MLTSRFLFMFIYSSQTYKPIKFCTCSCLNGEQRLKKPQHYLAKDILKIIITGQTPKIRCDEENLYTDESEPGAPSPSRKKKSSVVDANKIISRL